VNSDATERALRSDRRHVAVRALMGAAVAEDLEERIRELLTPPAWHRQAACRGTGSAKHFPAHGATAEAGRSVCAGCAVKAECLGRPGRPRASRDLGGGTSDAERRRMRHGVA
jgi:WhiB family redox-sensing transcriptional regulator